MLCVPYLKLFCLSCTLLEIKTELYQCLDCLLLANDMIFYFKNYFFKLFSVCLIFFYFVISQIHFISSEIFAMKNFSFEFFMDMHLFILPDYGVLIFRMQSVFIYCYDLEVTIDGVWIGEWIY
jgi:hypothetical protein